MDAGAGSLSLIVSTNPAAVLATLRAKLVTPPPSSSFVAHVWAIMALYSLCVRLRVRSSVIGQLIL